MHSLNAKILIAGSIAPNVYDMANDEYIEIIDIMKIIVHNVCANAFATK